MAETVICEICGESKSKINYKRHLKTHDGVKVRLDCKYCNRPAKNVNSNKQHEVRCKLNPEAIISTGNGGATKGYTWTEEQKKKHSVVQTEVQNRPELVAIRKIKCSEATTKYFANPENRKKHSDIMLEAVKKHPDSYSASNVSGRVKSYEVGEFTVKGTWELEVANYLNANGIKWTNIIEPIPYDWNGKVHSYFPDFYLTDFDVYIEVKGYQRDRDLAKWKSLDNLIILKHKEIKEIKNRTYYIERLT